MLKYKVYPERTHFDSGGAQGAFTVRLWTHTSRPLHRAEIAPGVVSAEQRRTHRHTCSRRVWLLFTCEKKAYLTHCCEAKERSDLAPLCSSAPASLSPPPLWLHGVCVCVRNTPRALTCNLVHRARRNDSQSSLCGAVERLCLL